MRGPVFPAARPLLSRRQMRLLFALLLALFSWRARDRFQNPNLRITFFDVGQGDGALIQFPYGKNWLVDSGGGGFRWNVGSRILYPELARLGILTLDGAVLSHPDKDHAEGFTRLFEDVTIREFLYNASFSTHPKMSELFIDDKKGVTRFTGLNENQTLVINGVKAELFPLPGKSTNDRALLLRLSRSGCTVLFTGDIEKEGERRAVKALSGPVTLLKVAHHGSRTSSSPAFLASFRPRFAVISVGTNRFGHPHPRVLERFQTAGIRILRTDFHGYVRFTFTPEGMVFCESALGDCGTFNCLK